MNESNVIEFPKKPAQSDDAPKAGNENAVAPTEHNDVPQTPPQMNLSRNIEVKTVGAHNIIHATVLNDDKPIRSAIINGKDIALVLCDTFGAHVYLNRTNEPAFVIPSISSLTPNERYNSAIEDTEKYLLPTNGPLIKIKLGEAIAKYEEKKGHPTDNIADVSILIPADKLGMISAQKVPVGQDKDKKPVMGAALMITSCDGISNIPLQFGLQIEEIEEIVAEYLEY
jgi:hypothetical protein